MTVITGNVANFSTRNKVPLKSAKLGIVATQDLHGQSGPWPGGGNKNLFPPKEVTHDGVTLSLRQDGGININGRCSAAFNATVKSDIKAGTYVLSCRFTGTLPTEGAARTQIYHQASGYSKQISNPDASESYTTCIIAEDLTNVEFRIRISANFTYQNVVYYPQFESGSSMTSFVPYSNICPINGASSVKFTRCGKNLFDGANVIFAYPLASVLETGGVTMRTVFSRCKPNTTYTISKVKSERFIVFWSEKSPAIGVSIYGQTSDNTATSITITTGATANYIYAFVYNANVDTLTPEEILSSVQIEEASSASDYELYKGVTQTISLGNTYYGGYVRQLQDGKRQFVCTHEYRKFNAGMDDGLWSMSDWGGGGKVFSRSLPCEENGLLTLTGAMSDIYKEMTPSSMYSYSSPAFCINGKLIRVRDNRFSTLTDWKEAVRNYNYTFVLETPAIIDLPDGEPITTLSGVNNVYGDNGETEVDIPNYFKCASVLATQNSNTGIYTASGSIANFNTEFAMPYRYLKAGFKATQDLHGQSGAYPPGGGVNQWNSEWEGGGISDATGLDYDKADTWRTDGYIPILSNTSYYICSPTGVSGNTIRARFYDSDKNYIGYSPASGNCAINRSFVSPSNAAFLRFNPPNDTCPNHDISLNYPSTDTVYHPYSNICPINGVSEVKVGCCNFNQLADVDVGVTRQGLIATLDSNGVITLTGVSTNGYSNITKWVTPIIDHKYLIGKTVVANPNNITFGWSFLNATKNPYIPASNETQWSVVNITSATNVSTGISGYETDTDFDGVKLKIVCIDLTQALGKEKADYIFSLPNYGVDVARQIFTKDYYPYNVGGSMVTVDSVNGEHTCPNVSIQLGNTYYGGYVEIDRKGKRQLVVTHELKHLKDLDVRYSDNSGVWANWLFFVNVSDKKQGQPIKCSYYNVIGFTSSVGDLANGSTNAPAWSNYVYWHDDAYSSVEDFKANAPDIVILIELANPIIIDLPDGDPINSLPGVNNVFDDSGETEVKYIKLN